MIAHGTVLYRAVRRLKWPGEAAVVVSVVHGAKGLSHNECPEIRIDGKNAPRISAFLVNGTNDDSPMPLAANEGKAFQGSIVLGMGFTFDDFAAERGTGTSLAEMERIITKDERNRQIIKPYLGGDEVNNEPTHLHHRYVIDFGEMPLRRDESLKSWFLNAGSEACDKRRRAWLQSGVVPGDYPEPVAADWPDLLEITERLVKPQREKDNRESYRKFWWQFAERRKGLDVALDGMTDVLAINCGATPHMSFATVDAGSSFAHSLDVIALGTKASFATLQSRTHEIWARFFSSSLEDRLRYAPSDCFATFPFPEGFETNPALEAAGQAYHDHRSQLMIDTNKGLTPTYNRFHDPYDDDPGRTSILRRFEVSAIPIFAKMTAPGGCNLKALSTAFLDSQLFALTMKSSFPARFMSLTLATGYSPSASPCRSFGKPSPAWNLQMLPRVVEVQVAIIR